MQLDPQKNHPASRFKGRLAVAAALSAILAVGALQAADKGPRAHAEGKYDTVSATYVVVEGDDLFAISERFEVPVETLKVHNKLHSDEVKPGEKLNLGKAAGHKSPAHQAAGKKPMTQMTCEDFLGLEEDFQPKAVYWAVAYGSKGQPEAEAMEVDGVETVTPFVIQECQKAPKESFWQKAKAEWEKLAKKM
jgi:LysM repeat protein